MPSKTDKQRRAMAAAAHGNSTLGIPQSVGQKFVRADAGKKEKPAALAKGGKLVDHGDHFKLHTAGGDVYTIAHHGLHPSTVKHFQSFAEGGTVGHYAAGGKAKKPADPEGEAINTVTPEEQSYVPGPSEEDQSAGAYESEGTIQEGMPAVTEALKKSNEGNAAQRMMDDATNPENTEAGAFKPNMVQGSFIKKADTSAGAMPPGAPQPAAAPEAPPAAPKLEQFAAAKVHDITPKEYAANEEAKAARNANAAAQEQAAGDTEAANKEKIQGMQDLQKATDAHMVDIQTRARQLRTDIENGKVDPDHYWHERGTGGRIAASIGLLLSGLGSGLGGGPNMAMKVIQSNIDRDIAAQEKNLETKKSLLSDTYRETGDLRLSHQIAEHTLMNVALAKLNTIAAKSSSASVRANAAIANAAGDEALAAKARQIADQRSINQVTAYNANVGQRNALSIAQMKAAGVPLKTINDRTNFQIGAIRQFMELVGQARGKNPSWGDVQISKFQPGNRARDDWEDLLTGIATEKGKIQKQGSPGEAEIAANKSVQPHAEFFTGQTNRERYLDTQEEYARDQARGISAQFVQDGRIDPFGDPKMKAWIAGKGPYPGQKFLRLPEGFTSGGGGAKPNE